MRLGYEHGIVSGSEGPCMNAAPNLKKKKNKLKEKVRGGDRDVSGDGCEIEEEVLRLERRSGDVEKHGNGMKS